MSENKQAEPVAKAVLGKREVSCHGPNRKYADGIVIQQLKDIEPDTFLYTHPVPAVVQGLVKAAFDWIESAPHGDNCFVSDNYEGDPGNCCNCGKDSLLSAYEELGQPEAQAVCQTCNGQGQIGGPSYREPDEGGEPCPDCNQATPAVAVNEQLLRALENLALACGRNSGWEDYPQEMKAANAAIRAAEAAKKGGV